MRGCGDPYQFNRSKEYVLRGITILSCQEKDMEIKTYCDSCGLSVLPDMHFCNIPGSGVTKREETDLCITFMYRKCREFSRFQIKHVTQ
jgi:hypothetical protein